MPRYSRFAPFALSLLLLSPMNAKADAPVFNNINAADFQSIVRELSADMSYTSVTPASSLGSVWGFEIGAVGGIAKTPEIQQLVKSASPNTDFKDWLPHGGALARLGIPYGFTLEAMYIPKVTISSVSLKETGAAVQWTLTDYVLTDLPFNVAVKGFYDKTLSTTPQNLYDPTSNSTVNAGIDFTDKLYGGQLIISKKISRV